MPSGKRMRMEDKGGDENQDDDDGFDPAEFYRQQQAQMIAEASKHVEKTREEIERVQAEADAEETGGGTRRGRRSAAAAASAAMSYLSTAEDQVDSVYFGTRKMGPPPAAIREQFQAPNPPKPRAPRGGGASVPRAPRARGGGRGRPPKPKRDWGGDCMMYYQCVEGSVTHQRCPDCDYYDTESKFCKQPTNGEVKCGNRPYDNTCEVTPQDGECPSAYGYFPVAENCKQYKICDNGIARYETCGTQADANGIVQQLLYNGDQIQCDWTYRVGCGSRPVCDTAGNCQCQLSEPVNPNAPCQGVSAIMIIADPFNCQNKLICMDGIVLENDPCPVDQFYEISTDTCKSDESVCNGSDQYRPICVDGASGNKQQCRCV